MASRAFFTLGPLFLFLAGCVSRDASRALTIRSGDQSEGTGPCPCWGVFLRGDGTEIPFPARPRLFVLSRNAFISDGTTPLVPPADAVRVRVARGFEHEEAVVGLPSAGTHELTIPLRRIADPRGRGWHSATAHMHLQVDKKDPSYPPAAMETPMRVWPRACGYDVLINAAMGVGDLPSVMGWAADYYPAGRWVPDAPTPVLYDMGEEFRANPEGHVLFWNLSSYVEPGSAGDESYLPDKPNWPPLLQACKAAVDQGGYVAWAHAGGGYSFEAGVALGVCHGICLGDMGFGYDRWYRLLNAGCRLSAVAGSDFIFDNGARFYAKVEGGLTWDGWMDAVRRGRTFATSGPLLFVTVEGKDPGEEIHLEAARAVTLRIEAASRHTFEGVEVVVNGRVAAEAKTEAGRKTLDVTLSVPITRSSWIAVRTTPHPGEDTSWRGAMGDPIESRHMRQAHTSPVYCLVERRPIGDPEACRQVARWIEEFPKKWAEGKARYPDAAAKGKALAGFTDALEILKLKEKRLTDQSPSGE